MDGNWLQLIDAVTLERAHVHEDIGRSINFAVAQGQHLLLSSENTLDDGEINPSVVLYVPS